MMKRSDVDTRGEHVITMVKSITTAGNVISKGKKDFTLSIYRATTGRNAITDPQEPALQLEMSLPFV